MQCLLSLLLFAGAALGEMPFWEEHAGILDASIYGAAAGEVDGSIYLFGGVYDNTYGKEYNSYFGNYEVFEWDVDRLNEQLDNDSINYDEKTYDVWNTTYTYPFIYTYGQQVVTSLNMIFVFEWDGEYGYCMLLHETFVSANHMFNCLCVCN